MQNLSSTFADKELSDKDKVGSKSLIGEDYKKSTGYFVTKRIIDLAGSLFGIIVLSPIMLLTAIAIKLSSKGPVFFVQERVGQDTRVFKMYKFRSMIIDAEELLYKLKDKNEMSGPMFKMKEDPRVTKVGRFIRKTSLDELPQLFNVLKGDMSLVGPRPNLPREVAKFEPWMRDKLIAKPGLTCYWQVMGRNDIDFKQWMELDIKYVRERSLSLDVKLILRTFRVLFGDKHAR
ncbi:sugar transferase [Desnuesiella massiliensis]|uniref:sugar transferase n=1 Tax=Desnuesiella massiliensis TaxID=1650662 RepID=UPI0006E40D57|nr:sugar transferase [Desnuesiella massiliensis]